MTYGHGQLHLSAIRESFGSPVLAVRFCTSETRVIHMEIVVFITIVIFHFMNVLLVTG